MATQEGLAEMAGDDPGDGFQDSFLLETQMNAQRMAFELREIARLLEDVHIAETPPHTDVVTLGHRVTLSLVYPYGEREALSVVLTPSPELALIGDHMLNGEFLISPQSALGSAIIGRPAGATFSYAIEESVVHGRILEIAVWEPAFAAAGERPVL
jgi:transcription elongation GreA/GreB family factor